MARMSPDDHCRQPYHVDLHVASPYGVEADNFFPVLLLGSWKTGTWNGIRLFLAITRTLDLELLFIFEKFFSRCWSNFGVSSIFN
jgi:hypothetical protein